MPPSDLYPEGLIVSGGKDQIIHVRHPSRNVDDDAEALLIGHGANVCALDITPNSQYIISGGWDQLALVWPIGKWGEKPVELKGHTASVWAVLAYDDNTIITGEFVRPLADGSTDQRIQAVPMRRSAYSSPPASDCSR